MTLSRPRRCNDLLPPCPPDARRGSEDAAVPRVRPCQQLLLFDDELAGHDPRFALWLHQRGVCPVCDRDVDFASVRARRDLLGTRISAMVCSGCSRRPPPPGMPMPVITAGSLLRLRLTQGPALVRAQGVTSSARAAVAAHDWDFFRNAEDALWAFQGGRCPLHAVGTPSCKSAPRLDHHHKTGMVRGLLGGSCNSLEGKGGRHADPGMLRAYRADPPAQQFIGTRGLSYRYMRTWDQQTYNRAALLPRPTTPNTTRVQP